MDRAKARGVQYHGCLVAFEGSEEIALTQLRLLPHSSKILVLPPLDDFTKQNDPAVDFDARSYILSIHEACNARFEAASSFLRGATPANKRLVFMPGGTASAQRSCVSAISDHLTDGDNIRAETIFNELVRGGVAGLRGQASIASTSPLCSRRPSNTGGSSEYSPVVYADAASQAMAAADALDRETESLQPNTDVDLSILGHKRSISVPMRRVDCELEEPTPFYVFGRIHGTSNKVLVVPEVPGSWSSSLPVKTGNEVDKQDHERIFAPQTPVPWSPSLLTGPWSPSLSTGPWSPLSTRPGTMIEKFDYERMFEPSTPGSMQDHYSRLSPVPRAHTTENSGESYLRLSMTSSALADRSSPRTLAFGSPPETPAAVYGRASMIDVRSSRAFTTAEPSTPRQRKRVRSLDRIYGSTVANQDISAGNFEQTAGAYPHEARSPSGSLSPRRYAPMHHLLVSTNSESAQSTSERLSQTTIRRPPPRPLDLSKTLPIHQGQYVEKGTSLHKEYTDKATWTGTFYVEQDYGLKTPTVCIGEPRTTYFDDDAESQADDQLETVLPVYEDLVIKLQDESSDLLLESIIEGFKAGKYPVVIPRLLIHDAESNLEPPETPSSRCPTRSLRTSVSETMATPPTLPPGGVGKDEYDPFAALGSSLQPPTEWMSKISLAQKPTVSTSAQSRRQSNIPLAMKYEATSTDFHELKTTNCKTPVGVQNMLRCILNDYFSPDTPGFHHFQILPDLGSLWRPVFRVEDARQLSSQGEKLDLILAVGSQQGVPRELLSSITGYLEKLGTKSNGVTRSGRLDLRYLIANAVQSHFVQDSDSKQDVNLLESPLLLATLVIPHLETYLATHCKTQYLLLEYQPEHLTVIVALQRLIGVTAFKIAGILNSDLTDTKGSGTSLSTKTATDQAIRSSIHRASLLANPTLMSLSGSVPSEAPRFSKANFLLTSCATESEISTFISTIWKVLVDISPFYIPEGSRRPSLSEPKASMSAGFNLPGLAVSGSGSAAYKSAAASLGFATPPTSPLPYGSGLKVTPVTKATDFLPKEHQVVMVKPSGASVRSSKSTWAALTSRSQRSHLRYLAQEAGNDGTRPGSMVSEMSDDDEGHNRFWADERRYMPLFLREPATRKGNSRKALKFLGLAN